MNPTLPTFFLHILQGQESPAQVLIFVLNCFLDAEFLVDFARRSLNLGAKEEKSLSRDEQYDLTFFLMYNCFFNYKVLPQNGRYH